MVMSMDALRVTEEVTVEDQSYHGIRGGGKDTPVTGKTSPMI